MERHMRVYVLPMNNHGTEQSIVERKAQSCNVEQRPKKRFERILRGWAGCIRYKLD